MDDLFAAALGDSPVGDVGIVEIVESVGSMPALTSGAGAPCDPEGRPQSHDAIPGGLATEPAEEIASAAGIPARANNVLAKGAPCARAAIGARNGGFATKAVSQNGRKRQAPGTVSLQCPKRKAPAENSPTLTEIEDRASTIRCVYAAYHQAAQVVQIPLWPQYRASWRNESSPDAAFLVVGNYERWFTQLVDAVTKDSRGTTQRRA